MALASTGGVAPAEVRVSEVEDPESAAGLGALLRRARERCGLSLDRIARDTKIPKRHLEALERNDLSVAPAGIYLRAEVRTYARAVDLDEGLALAALDRLLTPTAASHNPSAEPSPAPTAQVSSRVWLVRIALPITLALGAAVWFSRSSGAPDDPGARYVVPPSDANAVVRATPSGPHATTAAVANDSPRIELPTPIESGPAASSVATPAPPTKPPTRSRTGEPAPTVEPPRVANQAETSTAPGVTELVVTTAPSGARVTVDGISWGTSPVTIRHVSPGTKRIRVSLDGFVSAERSIALSTGRRQRVDVALRRLGG